MFMLTIDYISLEQRRNGTNKMEYINMNVPSF